VPPRRRGSHRFPPLATQVHAPFMAMWALHIQRAGRLLRSNGDPGFNDVVLVRTELTHDSREIFVARLPYQILVYIRRRPTPHTTEYLLLKRSPDRGGFWQGVTGGVEAGETLIQAARREVQEETGYQDFIRFMPLDFRYSFPLDRPRWGHLYTPEVEVIDEECFGAELGPGYGEPVLDPSEHDQYRWVDVQQALTLLTWPENQEALRRFADIPGAPGGADNPPCG
jgi:dihydroneopterin triphosphate diphosphatase